MAENHYMCIYRLISPSGKSYIGQAKNFNSRQQMRKNNYAKWIKGFDTCETPKLFNSFLKHGIENFKIEIIEENIESADVLDELEIYYIDFYDCIKNGYNLSAGGSYVGLNPETGRGYTYKSSEEYSVAWSDDRSAWNKEYYLKHREEIREKQREKYENGGKEKRHERYESNKEAEKDYAKNNYRLNREKCLEIKRKSRLKNYDKDLEYSRNYGKLHRDEINEKRKNYRINNKEECKEKRKQYRLKNQEKIKSQRKSYQKIRRFLSESSKENFPTVHSAMMFRKMFGGGRTKSYYFMPLKGCINEQGCWLYSEDNKCKIA